MPDLQGAVDTVGSIADTIRSNAAELRRLDARIDQTLRFRERSEADRDAWSRACAEFQENLSKLMYPGGEERWEAFVTGDPSEAEPAVVFLETDPKFFRSGYLKEDIWKHLKRAELSARQIRRLESVAVQYLNERVRREFWSMTRWARLEGTQQFWNEVAALASPGNGSVGFKAYWMLLAKQNLPVQNWVSDERRRARFDASYTANYWFGDRCRR